MGVPSDSDKKTITFVVGPTASGKSAWALSQVEKSKGIICNADSLQIYKKLDIGTAKPSNEERKLVPHFLFDLCEPDQNFTAGDYHRVALETIEKQIHVGPIYFVGGSGFYIQALEHGMYDAKNPSAETTQLLDQWEEGKCLRMELEKRDPESAARITPNDIYRMRRALEMILTEGKTVAELQSSHKKGQGLSLKYNVEKIGIFVERTQLRLRVQKRIKQMLKEGFIEEVEGLIKAGYKDAKPLKSVGYKECLMHLDGEISLDEMLFKIETATMQLAKKQMTWFKRDKEIRWIEHKLSPKLDP